MIRKLEVKGLNNRLDGAWEFNEDLNIITGRNGSGKTTLLKLIWYLISGNLEQIIYDIPFQFVSIKTDSYSLSIVQTENKKVKLECEFANQRSMDGDFETPLRREDEARMQVVGMRTRRGTNSLFFPSFRRIEGGFARISGYIPTVDPEMYEIEQSWRRRAEEVTSALQRAITQLSTMMSGYNDHKFIASISTHDIDDLLTKKYADIYRKTTELHAGFSDEITRKVSERKRSDDSILIDDIQKRIEQVSEKQNSLLGPFVVLDRQIPDILQYKGIHFTRGEVYLGDRKEGIEADKLSAGEKQMLSFLCYNAFSENTAIFIDEPELSLHIDWQRLLLPTLLEQETGNQFFVATHSPFIYTQYPEREILLDENRGGA